MNKSEKHPLLFLKWFLPVYDQESLYHTYIDLYRMESEDKGRIYAGLWIFLQVFKSIPGFLATTLYWRIMMIQSYLKIAFRHIMRQKIFTVINVSGLALGMAVCMLIALWIQHELSFDRFHENANEIYRVTEEQYQSSGSMYPVTVTPWPLAQALKDAYPEIIETARLRTIGNPLFNLKDKQIYERGLVAVDPTFLTMFTFPLISGKPESALQEPHTMVISEDMAQKYFGNEDPIGKTLHTINYNLDFTVTGVFENVPDNSHIQFEMLVPFEQTLRDMGWTDKWHTNNYQTYILLEKGVSIESLRERSYDFFKTQFENTRMKMRLQALTDIHLHSNFAIDIYGHSEDTSANIYIFAVIALFVLLIACLNFINLSTARSENRAKEIGLRKTVGAGRGDIINQFYGESLILTYLSLAIALLIVYMTLPEFNNISGKALSISVLFQPLIFLGIIGLTFAVGIISGSYPALVQSSVKPSRILKGFSPFSSSRIRSSMLRKSLVILQFIISIAIIAGTMSVYQQIQFMKNKKLGYNKDHIIYFLKRGAINNQFMAFKEELLTYTSIQSVSSSSAIPTYNVNSTTGIRWEGKDPEDSMLIYQFSVDHDYISTFGMELAEGRDFSREHSTDIDNGAYIMNETAIKMMNMENPVGKKFYLWNMEAPIIGVVKDFHFKSLHEKIEPLVLRIEHDWQRYAFLKISSENIAETLAFIEETHKSFLPEYPFTFRFLDEAVGNLYNAEKRINTILGYFTFISLFISCLGLIGMAAFTAQKRTKEIGIRKVLGATVSNIFYLLTKEFVILIGIANLVAWPLAYYTVRNWLDGFAYKMEISIDIYLISGIAAILIALLVISYQAVRAASTNPVDTMRYE